MGPKKIPYLITHDARTIRYPDPHIKANDTVQIDIATGKIQEHIKFDTGNFIKQFNAFIFSFFFR